MHKLEFENKGRFMTIKTKPVEYMHGKTKCIGYMAWDDSYADPKPCVLINHAWAGLDGFAQDKAITMAANGYIGFVLDNYGDGAQPETTEERQAALTVFMEDRSLLLGTSKRGLKPQAAKTKLTKHIWRQWDFALAGSAR